jgi:hypothetical protein
VLCSAIAFGISWPAYYLSIVLTHMFLLGPRPPFKTGWNFILMVAIASASALLLSYLFLPSPIIFGLIIGVILLNLFYADDKTISPTMRMWLLICSLVIPLMSIQSIAIGAIVGWALVHGTFVALVVIWIAFSLFPDFQVAGQAAKKTAPPKSQPAQRERLITAIKRTAVVYPVVLIFFSFEFQQSALILIYIAMYSSIPGFSKGFAAGRPLLISCITGGLVAFLLYEIVILVPEFSFLLLLMLAFSLWVGYEILGNAKYAQQVKAAFSTIIIVFGSAVGSDDTDAGGAMLVRVLQVSVVVVYLALAFGLIEKLFPVKKDLKTRE